jgi:hypothetical protein
VSQVEKLRAKTVADQAKNQAASLRKALDEAISRLQVSSLTNSHKISV